MRYAVDPRQKSLFDPASVMFSPMTIKFLSTKFLSTDWPGVFRAQMLHLMPVEALGKHFDAKLGCPTNGPRATNPHARSSMKAVF